MDGKATEMPRPLIVAVSPSPIAAGNPVTIAGVPSGFAPVTAYGTATIVAAPAVSRLRRTWRPTDLPGTGSAPYGRLPAALVRATGPDQSTPPSAVSRNSTTGAGPKPLRWNE